MSTHFLEGYWKTYKFEFCCPTASIISEVCDHMREYYMKDGALYKYLEWSEVTEEHTNIIVQNIIVQGLSFVVRDIETGKIVAVQLTSDNRLDSVSSTIPGFCRKIKAVNEFVEVLEQSTLDCFNRLFVFRSDIQNFAEIYYSSVARENRGQGICSEMYRRTLPFLKSKGLVAIRNTFTDPITRALGEKLGFHELGKAYLRDAKYTDGKMLFPGVEDEKFLTVAAIIL